MLKRLLVLLFIFSLGAAVASAYTVVLKNGKTMTGTLISETEQSILFKDDAGVQYSLKKANLDLEKMSAANTPPPVEAAPAMEAPAVVETPKKKAKVYTKEDVDSLRSKYPELSLGEPVENVEDFEGGVLKPSAYGRRIQEGATVISSNVAGLVELRDGMATAWELAASTGKDPAESVNAVLGNEKGIATMKSVSDDLATLGRWQESMANPPESVAEDYKLYVQALTSLSDFQRGLREWNNQGNPNLFKSRTSEYEQQINRAVDQIAKNAQQAPEAPPQNPEEENTEQQ